MSRRPTIKDVANHARLSAITVDRALNGRGKVRPETLRRIVEAAKAVGYHGAPLAEARLREDLPECRLGVLLLDGPHASFFRGLGAGIDAEMRAMPDMRGCAVIDYIGWTDPAAIGAKLRELGGQVDTIAAITIEHPAVTALKAQGVPVFAILSDFAPGIRASYVGLNNRKAGRAGAWFVSRVARRPGKVAAFVGSSRFHGHEMREIGFRTFLRERAPEFEVIDTPTLPGAEQAA